MRTRRSGTAGRRSETELAPETVETQQAVRRTRKESPHHEKVQSRDTSAGGDDAMTEYERERHLQMQRNRERMLQLQLPDMAAASFPGDAAAKGKTDKQKPTSRGVTGKRRKGSAGDEAVELRRSSRQRGVQADTALAQGIDYETRDGSVVLNSSEAIAAAAAARTPEKELPFSSLEATEELDDQFLARLQVAAADSQGAEGAAQGRGGAASPGAAKGRSLSLDPENVRKVTPRSVTIMEFFPSSDPGNLIIAAGDNDGHLGIWDLNKTSGGSGDEDDDAGNLLFKPHRQFISGVKWCRSGAGLCTLGYDGSLRLLDIEKGVFELNHHDADVGYSALGFDQGSETVYMGDSSGDVTTLDFRSGKPVSKAELHVKKINSLEVEPHDSRMFATSSTDTTVALWDVRKVDAKHPVALLQHGRSCHGAFWDPSRAGGFKHRLATISFDDTIRVFGSGSSQSPKKAAAGQGGFTEILRVKHNNNTGRWVLPFKATWSPAGDVLVVGCMQRGVDMLDSSSGAQLGNLSSELMTAIPMRAVFHPCRPILAAATSSGRIHVFHDHH